jgi:hypothetical protein
LILAPPENARRTSSRGNNPQAQGERRRLDGAGSHGMADDPQPPVDLGDDRADVEAGGS